MATQIRTQKMRLPAIFRYISNSHAVTGLVLVYIKVIYTCSRYNQRSCSQELTHLGWVNGTGPTSNEMAQKAQL